MHDKKDFFFWGDALGENVLSMVHSGERGRETKSGKEGLSTLCHKKRFKFVRMKDKHFQSA